MDTLTLPAAAPFEFGHSLRFLCGFPATAGEQQATGDTLVKALRVAGRPMVVRLTALPADQGPGLRAEVHADGRLSPEDRAALADRITGYLSLDDDLSSFYAAGRRDPAFAPVLDRLHGYHQVKFPTPLENVIWAILAQRIPLPGAARAKQALTAAFPGNRLTVDGVEHLAFPDHAQLAGLSQADLRELVRNERKAGYLHGTLRAWGETDESFLRTGPYEQVRETLLAMPGIGPWSAAFVMIRGLGRMEHLAYEKALLATAARVYGRPVTEGDLRELARAYGPDQGYWGHYLRAAG